MARSINESIKQPTKQPTNIMDMQLRKHNFLHNVFCLCRAGFCVCRAFDTFVTRNVLSAQTRYRHSVRKAYAIRLAPYIAKYKKISFFRTVGSGKVLHGCDIGTRCALPADAQATARWGIRVPAGWF